MSILTLALAALEIVLLMRVPVTLASPRPSGELEDCALSLPAELEIWLITMEPGGQVLNNYGHSALYVRDPTRGTDLVYNFGAFDDAEPDVLWRFLMGKLPFWLSTRSRASMLEFYGREERTVIASRLRLDPDRLEMLALNLEFLAKPQNRQYAYHWFRANCSTRIRDLLDKVTGKQISAQHADSRGATARGELLRHSARQPGFWFVQSWGLARGSDRPITAWEEMFLPANLRAGLLDTRVEGPSGETHALIGEECRLRQGRHPPPRDTAPRWGVLLWVAGLGLGGLFWMGGRRPGWRGGPQPRSRGIRVLLGLGIAVFGLFSASLGTASAVLWIFRGLEVYQQNENLFLANPLSILLVPAGLLVALGSRRGIRVARAVAMGLAALAAAGAVFGAVRGFPQSNLGMIGIFLPPLVAIALAAGGRTRPPFEARDGTS